MKIFTLTVFLLITGLYAQCQSATGIVLDDQTKRVLPFVNIGIKGTYGGTTTNGSGEFSINLPSTPKYRTLVFSAIGYQSKEYKVKEGESNLKIHLTTHTYDIDEITIMPDSTLRSFLRKAFDKIPDNYPSVPTKYQGFYRASIQNEQGEYLRFMEVLTEAYKSSYKNKEEGTVKALKSRKYIAENDIKDFPVHFYGGVHFCHTVDYIKNRSLFLSGSKKYDYSLIGIVSYKNQKVYEIKFEPNKSKSNRSSGYLYIDTKTLSYLKIEINKTPEELTQRSKSLSLPGRGEINSIEKWLVVNYELGDKYCYLKSIFHNETFLLRDSVIYKSPLQYIVTKVQDSLIYNIPYQEQIPITYTPAIDAVFYHQSDWKDFNTLPLESNKQDLDSLKVKSILSSKTEDNSDWRLRVMKFARNLELSYGINVHKIGYLSASCQLQYRGLNFRKDIKSADVMVSSYFQYGYKLSPHNYVQYQLSRQISKDNRIAINNFGLKRLIPLKTMGRQIIANVNMGWEWQKAGFSLGTQKSGQDFYFGGKKFKNEKVQAYAGYKSNGFSLGSGIDFQLSNLFHLTLSGNYFIPAKTQDIIIMQERSGFFLGRKKAHEKISDSNIQYSINGQTSLKSGLANKNWNAMVGIKMKL